MSAPLILMRTDVTAAEYIEVNWVADEALYDFVFIQAAKKAEVVNLACKIAVDVMLEVAFKLETLGILVINGGAGDVAFVGASLIG